MVYEKKIIINANNTNIKYNLASTTMIEHNERFSVFSPDALFRNNSNKVDVYLYKRRLNLK